MICAARPTGPHFRIPDPLSDLTPTPTPQPRQKSEDAILDLELRIQELEMAP